MADYDWFDRDRDYEPDPWEIKAAKYRPLGFEAVFAKSDFIGRQSLPVEYYLCRRGCGTLVWNPEDHMKNVCTQFNPRAGSDNA